MILSYIENHKSIESPFRDVELPVFAILTGKNGSGKTHLLNGVKEGKFRIEGIDTKDILYLNYLDFAQNFQTRTNRLDQITAWDRFNHQSNYSDVIFRVRQHVNEMSEFQDIIERSASEANKPIFDLVIEDLQITDHEVRQRVFETIRSAKVNVDTTINEDQFRGEDIGHSLVDSVLRRTKVLPSNITQKDFFSSFKKIVFGNSRILSDLSNVFFEYYKNIDRNERNERKDKPYLSSEEFTQKFGPAPWDLIRNIFTGFGLHFDVNDPVQEDIDPLDGAFGIVFKNNARGGKIVGFDDLSSGEQILITLVNAIYTASNRKGLPKLILLDEVDSPLNPSIIDSFISYIQENFVANGIRVIVATHSPSTVAFAPENSIYLVDTTQTQPLIPVNSNEAINKLSEGFITLSDLMNFEKIPQSKVVISEGKNYNYLSRAKDIFAPDDTDLMILNLNVGGTSQLRTLFEFIRNLNTSKTFIFVFDCDYRYKEVREENGALVKDEAGLQKYESRDLAPIKRSANANNKFFIFLEMSDSQSLRGIENMFPNEASKDFPGEFDEKTPKNKKSFEKYILNRSENNDFANFKSLFEFIHASGDYVNF